MAIVTLNCVTVTLNGTAMTAVGITTGAPVLGALMLVQSHSLTASGLVVGAPVPSAPALGQAHALSASGPTTGAPLVGTPALGQRHALTASPLVTGAPFLDSPARRRCRCSNSPRHRRRRAGSGRSDDWAAACAGGHRSCDRRTHHWQPGAGCPRSLHPAVHRWSSFGSAPLCKAYGTLIPCRGNGLTCA